MFKLIILYFSILIVFSACSDYNDVDHSPSVIGDIADSDSWYDDMVDEVLEMRVIIPTPNNFNCTDFNDTNGTLRPCTLADINSDIDANDDYEPELHVNMQTDDFISPNEMMNASFEQKGKSTRKAKQKSYRMKLDSKENLYRRERTFQLNKHSYDDTRVRNKLAFDLFKTIPYITSLKTEFVHLDINSSDVNNSDYGLFTHVEKVGKEFLTNRGWNKKDRLYKAQDFTFSMSNELVLDEKGEPVDSEAFDSVIEVENGKNHINLIDMLNDIELSKTDAEFEIVFDKYFNRNNYITWMASNIILGNKDTTTQNFFLYNPLYSDTFYFMPWDYDGTSRDKHLYAKWELGIATWWSVSLHRKFLKIKKNRDELDKMLIEIRSKYITNNIVKERLDVYYPIVREYVLKNPDKKYMDLEYWEGEFNKTIGRIEDNIIWYNDEKGSPMPYWQTPVYKDDLLILWWDMSVDLEGNEIVYDLIFADNLNLETPIVNEVGLEVGDGKLKAILPDVLGYGDLYYKKQIHLPKGKYYMKVIAREKNTAASNYQISFDKEIEVDYVTYFGLREIIIE